MLCILRRFYFSPLRHLVPLLLEEFRLVLYKLTDLCFVMQKFERVRGCICI